MTEEEGSVWDDLPDEVVEKILVRLSVYDVVRAGCACKRLRAFVSSSSRSLVSASPVSLLLLVDRDSSAWAYDLSREAWHKLSLAFLQPNLKDFSYPVASAGGLLCCGRGWEYAVCNPITRSFRRVPTLPYLVLMEDGEGVEEAFDEQAVGMVYESITGTYELYVIRLCCWKGVVVRMMCYSSALSEWRAMPPPLAIGGQCMLHSNTITACSSGLYTLWKKRGFLVVYGLCNGMWTEIKGPEHKCDLVRASLMDVHGSLHVVVADWPILVGWHLTTVVRIWKLHMERKEWMEVAKMPSWVQIDYDGLQYVGGKDGMVFVKRAPSDVLMCDLARNEWRWLKDVEMEADLESLVFEGSLSASA